jgi:hypothetical protein
MFLHIVERGKKTEELQSIPEESNTLMLHEEAEDLHALSPVILFKVHTVLDRGRTLLALSV